MIWYCFPGCPRIPPFVESDVSIAEGKRVGAIMAACRPVNDVVVRSIVPARKWGGPETAVVDAFIGLLAMCKVGSQLSGRSGFDQSIQPRTQEYSSPERQWTPASGK